MSRVVLGIMLIVAATWLPSMSAQEETPAPQQPQAGKNGNPDA